MSSIYITGFSALTSLADTLPDAWVALMQGKSGIAPIQQWPSENWQFPLGAEIRNFDAKRYIPDRKMHKLISRQDMFGLAAAEQVIQQTNLLEYRANLADPTLFNDRTGIYVASPGTYFRQQYDLFPAVAAGQGDTKIFAEQIFASVHPMWLLRILSNNVLAYAGMRYQFRGANQNVVNHGVSGMQAIIEACYGIQSGQIDRALVIGYEAALEPQNQQYYASIGVISQEGLFAYDKRASGTILAEGAGALLLENQQSAQARQIQPLAEIAGFYSNSEAQGVFEISSAGDGLLTACQQAFKRAELKPEQIGCVVAHANGSPQSDQSEAYVLQQFFKDCAVPISGFKWAIGHTLSAAGIIETAFALQALQQKILPGIANLRQPIDAIAGLKIDCDLYELKQLSALILNRGFGGQNAALIIQSI